MKRKILHIKTWDESKKRAIALHSTRHESAKEKLLLRRVICKGCGELTDRKNEYCFNI